KAFGHRPGGVSEHLGMPAEAPQQETREEGLEEQPPARRVPMVCVEFLTRATIARCQQLLDQRPPVNQRQHLTPEQREVPFEPAGGPDAAIDRVAAAIPEASCVRRELRAAARVEAASPRRPT